MPKRKVVYVTSDATNTGWRPREGKCRSLTLSAGFCNENVDFLID
jgi:hypothetical protein